MSTPSPAPRTLYEQLLAGQSDPSPASAARIRASASVVLWRKRQGHDEVFWAKRSPRLRFMGGWWAFPGGRLEPTDAALAVSGAPTGASDSSCHLTPLEAYGAADSTALAPALQPPDLVPGLVAGALRELFEETGLLVATSPASTSSEQLAAARDRLLAEELSFAAILDQADVRLDASALSFAGRWLTPPFAPIRFDNRFFLLPWENDRAEQPSILPGELVAGEWIRPRDALSRWHEGAVLVPPPILHILRVLDQDGPDRGLERLRHRTECQMGPFQRIEMMPGVTLLPLATPTLPPATHTNAFLLGTRDVVLVDPGPWPGAEQDRLVAALQAAAQDHHLRLRAVWLTHHHRDHVGAAMRIRQTFDVPIAAHADSRPGLQHLGIEVDEELIDGHRLTLRGEPSLELEVLHTPGHAQGHVAIAIDSLAAVLSGDLVSALSTMVIDPPEGDMDAYLQSLERVEGHAPKILLPAHGPLIPRAVERLRWFREHRLEREQQVLAAWQQAKPGLARQPASLVDAVYGNLDPRMAPVAARQIEAHLVRLRRHGTI